MSVGKMFKLNKNIKVSYAFGSAELTEDGKYIIDTTFVDTAKQFAQSRIRIANVVNGIKTINEVRREMGLNPVSWGDIWHPPAGVVPYGTFRPGNTPSEQPGNTPTKPQPTKFPSKQGIGKFLTDGSVAEEVPELTPFQEAKLKLLKTLLEKIG
jgi:hypothetical protein